MKSSKLWRIIWVVGIYALLLLILYLVVLYKVQWEHKDLNTYLYFYECEEDLCSSTNKQVSYYGKVLCENDVCPYITDIIDNNIILKNNNTSWIYNYTKDIVINNSYLDYRYIGHDMFVVTDNLSKQGVINLDGTVLVKPEYEYVDNYLDGIISYKDNGLYGIDSTNEMHQVEPVYRDLVLINDKIFAGMKDDNIYHLYSYSDVNNDNANKYNYVYSSDNLILVTNNKKIDILNTNLNSTLLMKIDTFYEYTTEKERDSLNVYSDGEYIYFRVFVSETEYIDYKYNILDKKLV